MYYLNLNCIYLNFAFLDLFDATNINGRRTATLLFHGKGSFLWSDQAVLGHISVHHFAHKHHQLVNLSKTYVFQQRHSNVHHFFCKIMYLNEPHRDLLEGKHTKTYDLVYSILTKKLNLFIHTIVKK